jgi:vacuolar-type H+-ATPase subunit I/STV1
MTPKPKSPESAPQNVEESASKEDAFSRQPSSSDADLQEISSLTTEKKQLEQEYKELLAKFQSEKSKLEKQIKSLQQTIQLKEESRRFNAELNALKESKTLDQFNAANPSDLPSRADRLLHSALKFDEPEAIETLHQLGYFERERKYEEAVYLARRQNSQRRNFPTLVFDTTKIGPGRLLHAVEQDAEKCFSKMLELGVALNDSFYECIVENGHLERFQNFAMLLKQRMAYSNPFVCTESSQCNEQEKLYKKYLDRLPQ